jgi:hypothetical protein
MNIDRIDSSSWDRDPAGIGLAGGARALPQAHVKID